MPLLCRHFRFCSKKISQIEFFDNSFRVYPHVELMQHPRVCVYERDVFFNVNLSN